MQFSNAIVKENLGTCVLLLFCFVYLAKKESLGECQLSEFSAQSSSKRRRLSSPSSSDVNLTDAVDLQACGVNMAACPSTDMKCAVETCAGLSQVMHLLGTGNAVLVFRASSLRTVNALLQLYLCTLCCSVWGFPGGSVVKGPTCQCRRLRFSP